METEKSSNRKEKRLTIGQSLRKCREEAGMEQADLAEKIEKSNNTISNWENDKADVRALYMLCDIADALNVSLDDLVGRRFEKK